MLKCLTYLKTASTATSLTLNKYCFLSSVFCCSEKSKQAENNCLHFIYICFLCVDLYRLKIKRFTVNSAAGCA